MSTARGPVAITAPRGSQLPRSTEQSGGRQLDRAQCLHVPVFLRGMVATCFELSTFSEPDFRQLLIIDADEF